MPSRLMQPMLRWIFRASAPPGEGSVAKSHALPLPTRRKRAAVYSAGASRRLANGHLMPNRSSFFSSANRLWRRFYFTPVPLLLQSFIIPFLTHLHLTCTSIRVLFLFRMLIHDSTSLGGHEGDFFLNPESLWRPLFPPSTLQPSPFTRLFHLFTPITFKIRPNHPLNPSSWL